ncbi:MAG: hypothetical protein AB8Y83_01385 [Coxiella endosymbiont of Haemaphysalis qinghaiensis]
MNTPHHNSTVADLDACIFCRLLYVAIITISFFYYFYPVSTTSFLSLSLHYLFLAIIAIIILFEIVGLRCKWVLWGQRKREGRVISSFSWTIISLCLVLLLAPGKQYAIPIVVSCSFIDPLLGELYRTRLDKHGFFSGCSCCCDDNLLVGNLVVQN